MSPANSTPAACTISLTGMTARSPAPWATILVASVPRGVILTLTLSAMPSRGKRSVLSQMPLGLTNRSTSRSEGGPPRPGQLASGKDDHARDEEQKYRDCQIGM